MNVVQFTGKSKIYHLSSVTVFWLVKDHVL